jgi:hypothetical protein
LLIVKSGAGGLTLVYDIDNLPRTIQQGSRKAEFYLGILKGKSPAIRQKIIDGRIKSLQDDINKQYDELQKVCNVCDERGL